MRWIFLSPHYDDAVFSCGGGIWELRQSGQEVEVWTICGGQPPEHAGFSPYVQELHQRWGAGLEAVALRRAEDDEALNLLEVKGVSFSFLDCIYRTHPNGQFLYTSDEALFGKLDPSEYKLIEGLSEQIIQRLTANSQIICPLGVGNHVDHQLTRLAAERTGLPLWYYAEIPYIFYHPDWQNDAVDASFQVQYIPISEAGFKHWLQAVSAYRSQLSTFWESPAALQKAFATHWRANPVLQLWRRNESTL
jgi:LmbE family N-acetylglucosaminyl deacetylase